MMSRQLIARGSYPRFFAIVIFLGSAGLLGLAQQPPREIEDPKAPKFPKKISVDDDDTGPGRKKAGGEEPGTTGSENSPPDVRLEELARAAEEAKNPVLKETFSKFIVPFDRITDGTGNNRVKPIPFRQSEWAKRELIGVIPLDKANRPGEQKAVKVADVKGVEHFESMIQAEVDKLQKQKLEGATPAEQLAAAEKLLAAAMRFHEFSRTPKIVDGVPRHLRRGDGWDEIRDSTAKRLRGIQLDLLKVLAVQKDALKLRELTQRMMAAYPKDAEVAKQIAAVQIAEIERLIKDGSDQDLFTARRLIDELESVYPGSGGEAAKKIRAQFHELAVDALKRAKDKKASGDDQAARNLLGRATLLDPEAEGIREMQKLLQLEYPILYVGVKQFPQYMSPARARLDSEKQAVELMFEGLLEEVPDESGAVRYRPGASIGMPIPTPSGREFFLRTFKPDPTGRPGFEPHDVVDTVSLLRTGNTCWAAYPLGWLSQEPPVPTGKGTVRISFEVAHPDPRALLTFKILPARYLVAKGYGLMATEFAESPMGTGPFRLYSKSRSEGGNTPREMVFVNNPSYGQLDRSGLPSLREVRLVETSKLDPVKAFMEGKLHMLPDIPTSDIDKYTDSTSGMKNKVDVVTSVSNRRVYILAVNLRRPWLQSQQLRQGISFAIDREDILRKEFRAGKLEMHKPMSGPFPPGSWAADRGPAGPPPMKDVNLAVVRLKAHFANQGAKTEVKLNYPDDDPRAEKACTEIKKQIEAIFQGETDPNKKLRINLESSPMDVLLRKVQDEHSYDLAYIPFDYPDDWYPFALGAALDPNAEQAGGEKLVWVPCSEHKSESGRSSPGSGTGQDAPVPGFRGSTGTAGQWLLQGVQREPPVYPTLATGSTHGCQQESQNLGR